MGTLERTEFQPEQVDPQDLDKIVGNASPAVNRYSRRQILKGVGLLGLGIIIPGVNLSFFFEAISSENAERERINKENPKIPKDQIQAAKKVVQEFEEKSQTLAQEERLEELPASIDQTSLKTSYETLAAQAERGKRTAEVWSLEDKIQAGAYLFVGVLSTLNSASGIEVIKRERHRLANRKQTFIKLALEAKPEWKERPPKQTEIEAFCAGLSYLPPVGSKVPLVEIRSGEQPPRPGPLEPSLTAEQQAEKLFELRRERKLGEVYLHQLTVQGRLPDKFKYCAIALVLTNPYRKDWNQPFFKAPWGQIAPMVHDGGLVDQDYSPVWDKVEGRTDFIERISLVYEPDLEKIEQLDPSDLINLSQEQLDRARTEQEEKARLLIEAKAYQRLALALHAKVGTAPKAIPKDIRRRLASEWDQFEQEMTNLLLDYQIQRATEVRWFENKPQYLNGWYAPRFESDFGPIKEELIKVEEAKNEHPELREKTIRLLVTATTRIDQIIGLYQPSEN